TRCSASRLAAGARGSRTSSGASSRARASRFAIIALAAPRGRAPPAAAPCMPSAGRGRLLVLFVIVLALAAFFAAGAQRYFTFENIKAQQAAVDAYYHAHPWQTALAYFALYIALTGLSLAGAATLLTLLGGAIFGLLWGTLIVSFASSIGATVAFLVSRLVLRDWVQSRFGRSLETINRGIEREGGLYLFTLRLIPAVPYFAINLAMGLTPIRTWTFYWVSQLGMLAGTLGYVHAATHP